MFKKSSIITLSLSVCFLILMSCQQSPQEPPKEELSMSQDTGVSEPQEMG